MIKVSMQSINPHFNVFWTLLKTAQRKSQDVHEGRIFSIQNRWLLRGFSLSRPENVRGNSCLRGNLPGSRFLVQNHNTAIASSQCSTWLWTECSLVVFLSSQSKNLRRFFLDFPTRFKERAERRKRQALFYLLWWWIRVISRSPRYALLILLGDSKERFLFNNFPLVSTLSCSLLFVFKPSREFRGKRVVRVSTLKQARGSWKRIN